MTITVQRFKVGDIVIWRSGKSKSKDVLPIGIEGCEIIEIGVARDGRPAARLKLPEFFAGLVKNNPDTCNAYLADLE
jgi:hypothetical protein